MTIKIADLRQDYLLESLDVSDVNTNPFLQFEKWFNEALKSEILEPNAMTLATVSSEGKPSARVVLLKGLDTDGFVFTAITRVERRKTWLKIHTWPCVSIGWICNAKSG